MKKIGFIVLFLLTSSIFCLGQILDTVCVGTKGDVYRITPTPGSTYFWQVNGGVISASNGSDITVDWGIVPGIYTIKVWEINNEGCRGDTVFAQVYLFPGKNITITATKDPVCAGDTLTLIASGANKYIWSSGETTSSIKIRPTAPVTYQVTGGDTNTLCNGSANIKINVNPKPIAAFSAKPNPAQVNETVFFTYTGSSATVYQWMLDSIPSISTQKDPQFAYSERGLKNVRLVVQNQFGCSDTTYGKVLVEDIVRIFIPNAFTPNGDEKNEGFTVVGTGIKEFSMEIFNRWGEKILNTTDIQRGWDGNYMGKPSPEGVYMYIIAIKGANNRLYNYSGSFTLLR